MYPKTLNCWFSVVCRIEFVVVDVSLTIAEGIFKNLQFSNSTEKCFILIVDEVYMTIPHLSSPTSVLLLPIY